MTSKKTLNKVFTFILFSIICISCTKKDSALDTSEFKLQKTNNKVLIASGVSEYRYRVSNEIEVLANYNDLPSGMENALIYREDTILRVSQIKATNKKQSFTLKMDQRAGIFSFSSSGGKIKEYIFKSKEDDNVSADGWYEIESNKIATPDWMNTNSIDSRYVLNALNLLGEIVRKNNFKSPISAIREREALIMLKLKVMQMGNSKINRTMNSNVCDRICSSHVFYNMWSTQACNEGYYEIASRCSNEYCIGDCGTRTCDCFGMTGDFLVACKVFSKACGEATTIGEIGG